jgi:prolipoprotein diacylglyceryltransferase
MGKVLLGANSQHHDSLYGNLFHSPVAILKELPACYPYEFFNRHFKQLYRALIVLLIGSILLLQVKKGKRLSGLFVLAFSCTYFVVACTSFKKGDANMQMEKYLFRLCFLRQLVLLMAFVIF